MNRLRVDLDICTGCRRCELACSFAKTGRFDVRASRIRVVRFEKGGVDIPVACQLPAVCQSQCIAVCPVNAISRSVKTGAVKIDVDRCSNCKSCVTACPLAAVNSDRDDRVIICDLCGGNPACVAACMSGALTLEPLERATAARRRAEMKPLAESTMTSRGVPVER